MAASITALPGLLVSVTKWPALQSSGLGENGLDVRQRTMPCLLPSLDCPNASSDLPLGDQWIERPMRTPGSVLHLTAMPAPARAPRHRSRSAVAPLPVTW